MVDTRLPFGRKSAPGIFHQITQAVKRMMARRDYSLLVVYLDDFLIIGETKEACQEAYDALCNLLVALGFQLSSTKLIPPTQCLVFLGAEIDTVNMSLSLPQAKLEDLKSVVLSFLHRQQASKRQLQQLAGKLNWACKVVYGGRTLLRRVLDCLNTLTNPSSRCRLTADFHKDLLWWYGFLDSFNGKCDFMDNRPVSSLYTDASQFGLGASFEGDWFYSHVITDYPWLCDMHINYKEAVCVILAVYRWASHWQNKTVIVRCDNTAAVAMLNKGSTRHPVMMQFLRGLFWLSATFNFRIKAYHIPGVQNVEADHVSRLHESSHFLAYCTHLLSCGVNLCTLVACHHMSESSYYYLLGRYSIFA